MSKLGAFAAILLVTMVGCSVNPQGQTVINDQAVTLTASVAATSGFIALSANQQTAAEVIPAAQLTYEVASAVNTAAKGGVPLCKSMLWQRRISIRPIQVMPLWWVTRWI